MSAGRRNPRRYRLRHHRVRHPCRSTTIWTAYLGYAVLGGIGSGMVYSSAINIVPKWYPERGWRTGFVNGGWATCSVPFIIVIGGFYVGLRRGRLSPGSVKRLISSRARS